VEIAGRVTSRTDLAQGKGHGPRVMIFEPPRHGKSLTASTLFPAWFLGINPGLRVVVASYEQGLAVGFARRARDILLEWGPLVYDVHVRQDTKRASLWETDQGGGMQAVGVGSGVTGRGADLLIIDDPIKDAVQAQSEVSRQSVWDWWTTTARTRLAPGGGVLVIMTRWHEDDLAGRLLREDPTRDELTGRLLPDGERREDVEGDEWEVLCMPAVAESDHPLLDGPDPLGRADGEALWPKQYDERFMERTRKATGDFWFSAMYQQRPAPAEGGLFKRANFRYWTGSGNEMWLATDNGPLPVLLSDCQVFQTCDVAATEKESSDYTALCTWAWHSATGNMILLDMQRERIEGPKQPAWVTAQFGLWKPSFIGIESKTFGLTLIQALSRLGLPVRKLIADTDKVARATTAGVRYETHKVFHPASHANREAFEHELASFPTGAHDDWVDCVSYAALQAMQIVSHAGRARADPTRGAPLSGALTLGDR